MRGGLGFCLVLKKGFLEHPIKCTCSGCIVNLKLDSIAVSVLFVFVLLTNPYAESEANLNKNLIIIRAGLSTLS